MAVRAGDLAGGAGLPRQALTGAEEATPAQWLQLAGLHRALRQPRRALEAVHRALTPAPQASVPAPAPAPAVAKPIRAIR